MKVYQIPSPDALERASDVAKWEKQRIQILNHVALWRRRIKSDEDCSFPPVTLELGRQAQLFRLDDGGKKLMGTMYVTGARQFVEDEALVEE